ncbi:MAG: hypothetical protein ACJASV_003101 [Pseudorhodobacter sp.]|jgi:hypothetical protein
MPVPMRPIKINPAFSGGPVPQTPPNFTQQIHRAAL